MAVGRISGPLLKANLLRDGVDLAFETDLLYLDVVNGRIGIKTDSPTHDLTVNGTTRTTNLEVTNQLDIGNLTVLGNTITSNNGVINFNGPNGSLVNYQAQLQQLPAKYLDQKTILQSCRQRLWQIPGLVWPKL